MRPTYRCGSCQAHFRGRRRRCPVCGGASVVTDRTDCKDCDATLLDGRVQRCPACGSGDAERLGSGGR